VKLTVDLESSQCCTIPRGSVFYEKSWMLQH